MTPERRRLIEALLKGAYIRQDESGLAYVYAHRSGRLAFNKEAVEKLLAGGCEHHGQRYELRPWRCKPTPIYYLAKALPAEA